MKQILLNNKLAAVQLAAIAGTAASVALSPEVAKLVGELLVAFGTALIPVV